MDGRRKRKGSGAGDGNRTRISCLEGKGLTITQRPLSRTGGYFIGVRGSSGMWMSDVSTDGEAGGKPTFAT